MLEREEVNAAPAVLVWTVDAREPATVCVIADEAGDGLTRNDEMPRAVQAFPEWR